MAALSYCSNFGYQDYQQDYYSIYQQAEPEYTVDQLFNFDESSFSDSFINPLFNSDEVQNYSETYDNLIPYLTSPSHDQISLTPDIINPVKEFHTPKRQKLTNSDEFQVNLAEYMVNSDPVSGFLPEISAPLLPKFEAPTVFGFNVGRSDNNNNNVKKSLSPQSIAARERRRKITDKTHELGKLIPGGSKMNTAEMLQSASNYVKFLQAQVQLLQFMDSTSKEKKVEFKKNGLQVLLTSSTMQEKLYSQEKCLVSKEFLETLKNDSEIQLKPFVINEIDQLIGKQ